MNFHVGTFRLHEDFWPILNSPLEHLMKFVLSLLHCSLHIHRRLSEFESAGANWNVRGM